LALLPISKQFLFRRDIFSCETYAKILETQSRMKEMKSMSNCRLCKRIHVIFCWISFRLTCHGIENLFTLKISRSRALKYAHVVSENEKNKYIFIIYCMLQKEKRLSFMDKWKKNRNHYATAICAGKNSFHSGFIQF
jgi:hypothetical protein